MNRQGVGARLRHVTSIGAVLVGAVVNLATTASYCQYAAHTVRTDSFEPGQNALQYRVLAPAADFMQILVSPGCEITWANPPSGPSLDAGWGQQEPRELSLDCRLTSCGSNDCRDACRSLVIEVKRGVDVAVQSCTLDVTAGQEASCSNALVELDVEAL